MFFVIGRNLRFVLDFFPPCVIEFDPPFFKMNEFLLDSFVLSMVLKRLGDLVEKTLKKTFVSA